MGMIDCRVSKRDDKLLVLLVGITDCHISNMVIHCIAIIFSYYISFPIMMTIAVLPVRIIDGCIFNSDDKI